MSFWLSQPGEAAEVFRWIATLVACGLLMLPVTIRLLPHFPPFAQVVLAKTLGWLLAGYVGWLAAALGIISFHAQAGVVAFLVLLVAWALGRDTSHKRRVPVRAIVLAEVIFTLLFLLGLAQRLSQPDLLGLEKPTEMGFLSALMLAETMPPPDAWFAGHGINYYYLGHAGVAVFAVLTDIAADHAYQLATATVFALTGCGVAALVQATLWQTARHVGAVLAGLGAAAALYAGNLHSFLYSVLRGWMPATNPDFYFPDSTRFIGFDPDTGDKGFTEFTAYAFTVGDLHAHVLATPVFLAAMAVMIATLQAAVAGKRPAYGPAITFGALIGLVYGVNSWDVAILGLGALAVWVALALREGRDGFDRMIALALAVSATGIAVAAPFAAHFIPFGEGIAWAGAQSPLWQLAIVHGMAIPALVALAALAFARHRSLPFAIAVGLALWGLCLIALPEILRVEDIYGQDHRRANTMFKLTFRSQTILLIAALVTTGILAKLRGSVALLGALVVLSPLVAGFSYVEHTFKFPRLQQSLDGYRHLGPRLALAQHLATVPWPGKASLIEAPSDSFTDGAALATASGRSSVIGWTGHIRLWHAAPDTAWGRHHEIQRFFQSADRQERCRTLRRYDVAYIAFTEAEQSAFPELRLTDLVAFGHAEFQGEGGVLIRVDPRACSQRAGP